MRLALLLAAALAAPALAQDPVTLVPGHPDLTMPDGPPVTGVTDVHMIEPETQTLGLIWNEAHLDGDVLTLVSRTEIEMDFPARFDSTRLRWPSLTPLSDDARQGVVVGSATFSEGRVEGTYDGGQGALPFDFDLDAAVFSSSALPLLALAIPHEVGYSAVVPTFSAHNRFGNATLTVTGDEEVEIDEQTIRAVVVEQTGGDGLAGLFTQRHYIDPEARQLLYTSVRAPDGLFHFVPRTGALGAE